MWQNPRIIIFRLMLSPICGQQNICFFLHIGWTSYETNYKYYMPLCLYSHFFAKLSHFSNYRPFVIAVQSAPLAHKDLTDKSANADQEDQPDRPDRPDPMDKMADRANADKPDRPDREDHVDQLDRRVNRDHVVSNWIVLFILFAWLVIVQLIW